VARRRLTLKRIDPWSVLKFGFVANLALLAIWLLGAGVIWFFVRQLGLIEKVCEIASDVGFVECGVNGGNLFRALLLLGLLGTVVQTGLVVFLAFLHNLIADLVGGVGFTFTEEGGTAPAPASRSLAGASTTPARTRRQEPAGAGAPPPLGAAAGRSAPAPSRPASPVSGSMAERPATPSPAGGPPGAPSAAADPADPGEPSRDRSPGPAASSPPPDQGRGEDRPSGSRSGAGADWDLFGPRGPGSGRG
jgi:hypothetical protein